jgi:AraC-like DNA-binding protein
VEVIRARLSELGFEPGHERSTPVRVPAEQKRTLLEQALAQLGPEALSQIGRTVCSYTGHPFVTALRAARNPAEFFRSWQRLEVLGHSSNRVQVDELEERRALIRRVTDQGRSTSRAEDMFVLGILSGFLECVGAEGPAFDEQPDRAGLPGRRFELRWSALAAPHPPPAGRRVWGAHADFARAVLVDLMRADLEVRTVAEIAERFALSPRTLQRRLTEAGTSFRALVSVARVRLAADLIVATRQSLTSVAHACGFADSAHFSREFRDLIGIPPSWFVKAVRPDAARGR